MSMQFEEVVTKIMTDATFRDALKADPDKALNSAGVRPTPELIQTLKSIDWRAVGEVTDHYSAGPGIST
jgi:hypothetical protein